MGLICMGLICMGLICVGLIASLVSTVDAGINHQLESEGGAGAVGVAGVGAAIAYVTLLDHPVARLMKSFP